MIELGKKYNMLIPIEFVFHNGRNKVRCMCDCGGEIIVRIDAVLKGNNKSCGCLARRHNASKTKEYKAWCKMKERCKGLDDVHKRCYSDRGITVCERWINSFENFIKDMGIAPSPKHSIDRINVNGNYEPSNCRWATTDIQVRNTRTNVNIEYNGETLILKDWCKKLNLQYTNVCTLIKREKASFDEIVKSNKYRNTYNLNTYEK